MSTKESLSGETFAWTRLISSARAVADEEIIGKERNKMNRNDSSPATF